VTTPHPFAVLARTGSSSPARAYWDNRASLGRVPNPILDPEQLVKLTRLLLKNAQWYADNDLPLSLHDIEPDGGHEPADCVACQVAELLPDPPARVTT